MPTRGDESNPGGGDAAPPQRLVGLDSLRAAAAFWVFLSHGGAPPIGDYLSKDQLLPLVVRGLYNCAFNGPAAVVVFFLISGLCIHYPHVGKAGVDVARFLTQRMIRIGCPLLALLFILNAVERYPGVDRFSSAADAVLWSLYCELAYYLAYPLLFRSARIVSWRALTACAFVISIVVLAFDPAVLIYPDLGILRYPVVCLPFWLLGCMLAQALADPQVAAPISVLWWRLAAIGYSWVCIIAVNHFRPPIPLTWSMIPFGLFCYYWILAECRYFAMHPPPKATEWAGSWSYSLYLWHMPIVKIVTLLLAGAALPLVWITKFTVVIGVAILAFILVERPSHQLARRMGGLVMAARARRLHEADDHQQIVRGVPLPANERRP